MNRVYIFVLSVTAALTACLPTAHAFSGLYLAKSDAPVLSRSSKVVIARHDTRTVMTIASDFQGDVSSFAILIPVPDVVTRGQVNITDNRIIDHLDAYTAPRALEYIDEDPCLTVYSEKPSMVSTLPMSAMMDNGAAAKSLGVKVEEQYAAGEYDISVLSAKESKGLIKWLEGRGYDVPDQAEEALEDYIDDGMKFFVATVNLLAFERAGYHYLRPIQVAYESDKLLLPLRLGAANADGAQDVTVFALTQGGRVEPANYRMVNIPTGEDLPLYTAEKFDAFYDFMFARQAEKEEMKSVFLEYAWDMAWCDPCTTDPMASEDLVTLGAWWLDKRRDNPVPLVTSVPGPNGTIPQIAPAPAPVNVFVTRMHMRYMPDTVKEDMVLQVTDNRDNFQAVYNFHQPWRGEASCEQAAGYYENLPERFEKEAQNLSSLTGWDVDDIRAEMSKAGQPFDFKPTQDSRPWWEQMWDQQDER